MELVMKKLSDTYNKSDNIWNQNNSHSWMWDFFNNTLNDVNSLLDTQLIKENDTKYYLINWKGEKVVEFTTEYYWWEWVEILWKLLNEKNSSKWYTTHWLKLLCESLFNSNESINFIYLFISPQNKASLEVAKKAGFVASTGYPDFYELKRNVY